MKLKLKSMLVVLMLMAGSSVMAQNADNRWAFNVSANLSQYDGTWGNEILSLGTFGLNVGPEIYLNRSFNTYFTVGVNGVTFDAPDPANNVDAGFIDVGWGFNYKLNNGYILPEDSKIQPYLALGIGNVYSEGGSHFSIPYGAGFRVELDKGIDLRVAATYHIVEDDAFNYFQNTIGLVLYKGGKKRAKDTDGDGIADDQDDCPSVAGLASRNGCPAPLDSDGDGVIDDEDRCPQVAGSSSLQGCPDSDGDGIEDSKDNCPNERGTQATNGCPDSDGDGIKDSDDACPNIAGSSATNGCPDSDGDGIIDSEDRCPNQAGIEANHGCPEIDEETKEVLAQALEGVQFESGRDVIKRSSYEKLDKVVDLMNAHSEFNLKISGYTDNTGNADFNLELSDKRAKAAKQYIVNKGIDASRIEAHGYGIANPVADNSTAAGRAKNRRVEFEVTFE